MSNQQLYNICPFTIFETRTPDDVGDSNGNAYVWKHKECIREYCRLWTYKAGKDGSPRYEGCSLEFIGCSDKEIELNQKIRKEVTDKNR